VVIVWNDMGNGSVADLSLTNIGVPIHVVNSSINSLNNRFLPYDIIETDAVATMDDDVRGMSPYTIRRALKYNFN